MDTVSESSMAASASEASPSSTTTTPRSTSTPLSAPPSPAASPSHPTPSSNLPRISSIPVTISPPPPAFSSPRTGTPSPSFRACFEVVLGLGLGIAPLVSGEDGEVVDVFSAKDERIRGFRKLEICRRWGRWGFHGGRGDGDEVRLGLLKARFMACRNGSNSVSDPSLISNGSETKIIRNGIYSVSDPSLNQKRNRIPFLIESATTFSETELISSLFRF
ncbi:hypothetical protein Syun_001902 [Stephania yunnanensis]|uniref:Uncharacterized protein n=1 Tax=Stephania yunnanensis TaxID=152371 RepID=A0AAP0Q6R1_9MAGN